MKALIGGVALAWLALVARDAATQQIVSVSVRPDATQAFFRARVPQPPYCFPEPETVEQIVNWMLKKPVKKRIE